jgi:hypothetical protein
VLNSLGLIALSTLLVYTTQIYWDKVHYLFFGLMALEALRLADSFLPPHGTGRIPHRAGGGGS